MNLYLRLLWTLLRCWRLPQMLLTDTLSRQLRVLPNDLDLNLHMNNGRYLTLIDLMLLEFFGRTGFAKAVLKNGWRPMSGGAIITYRRGLQPLERYTLHYRHAGSNSHWNFMHFEFVNQRGELCAAGYMKGAAVAKTGLVPSTETYASMGLRFEPMALPQAVVQWLEAEQAVVSGA